MNAVSIEQHVSKDGCVQTEPSNYLNNADFCDLFIGTSLFDGVAGRQQSGCMDHHYSQSQAKLGQNEEHESFHDMIEKAQSHGDHNHDLWKQHGDIVGNAADPAAGHEALAVETCCEHVESNGAVDHRPAEVGDRLVSNPENDSKLAQEEKVRYQIETVFEPRGSRSIMLLLPLHFL